MRVLSGATQKNRDRNATRSIRQQLKIKANLKGKPGYDEYEAECNAANPPQTFKIRCTKEEMVAKFPLVHHGRAGCFWGVFMRPGGFRSPVEAGRGIKAGLFHAAMLATRPAQGGPADAAVLRQALPRRMRHGQKQVLARLLRSACGGCKGHWQRLGPMCAGFGGDSFRCPTAIPVPCNIPFGLFWRCPRNTPKKPGVSSCWGK